MAETMSDEGFLLALLNTTPVVDGAPTDDLEDRARARKWLASASGQGTDPELRHVLEVRAMLQAIVRGERCCSRAQVAGEQGGEAPQPGPVISWSR